MALIDIVRNRAGLEVAAFLSSLDARRWADELGGGCEVSDWGGTVTRHERGQPMQIIKRGCNGSFNHVLRSFPDAEDATGEQVSA